VGEEEEGGAGGQCGAGDVPSVPAVSGRQGAGTAGEGEVDFVDVDRRSVRIVTQISYTRSNRYTLILGWRVQGFGRQYLWLGEKVEGIRVRGSMLPLPLPLLLLLLLWRGAHHGHLPRLCLHLLLGG
jgi:hypothetical protein